MNNENEIKEMAKALRAHCPNEDILDEIPFNLYAANMVIYGYGDKKQAVKEFAEKLEGLAEKENPFEGDKRNWTIQWTDIDNLMTELYGGNNETLDNRAAERT